MRSSEGDGIQGREMGNHEKERGEKGQTERQRRALEGEREREETLSLGITIT